MDLWVIGWRGSSGGTLRAIDVSKIFGGIRATLTFDFPATIKLNRVGELGGAVAEKRKGEKTPPTLTAYAVNPPGAANRASQAPSSREFVLNGSWQAPANVWASSFVVTRASCTLAVNTSLSWVLLFPHCCYYFFPPFPSSSPSPPCQDLMLPS